MKNCLFNKIISICTILVSSLFVILVILYAYNTGIFSGTILEILKIVFSGIAGVIISAILVILQIRKNTLAIKISNQIELRKLFSEKNRMEMSRCIKCAAKNEKILLYGDNEYFKTKSEFNIHRDDYLGIFEIAYFMLNNDQIDRDMFFQSYSYKISNIEHCQFTHEEIYNPKNTLWTYMKNLIELNRQWKNENNIR